MKKQNSLWKQLIFQFLLLYSKKYTITVDKSGFGWIFQFLLLYSCWVSLKLKLLLKSILSILIIVFTDVVELEPSKSELLVFQFLLLYSWKTLDVY